MKYNHGMSTRVLRYDPRKEAFLDQDTNFQEKGPITRIR